MHRKIYLAIVRAPLTIVYLIVFSLFSQDLKLELINREDQYPPVDLGIQLVIIISQ